MRSHFTSICRSRDRFNKPLRLTKGKFLDPPGQPIKRGASRVSNLTRCVGSVVQIVNCNLASVWALFPPIGRFMNKNSAGLGIKYYDAATGRAQRVLAERRAKRCWRVANLLIPDGLRRRAAGASHQGQRWGSQPERAHVEFQRKSSTSAL